MRRSARGSTSKSHEMLLSGLSNERFGGEKITGEHGRALLR